MKIPACIFLLLLNLIAFPFISKGQPFITKVYTANNGLPDANTLWIYQDKTGYLWITTYSGLSRFDGQRFVTVEEKTNNAAIQGKILLQDNQNRYWIHYKNSIGLLSKDTILTYPTSDGRSIKYVFSAIQLSNGKIWAMVDGGAYEFNRERWEKIDFPAPYAGLNCRQVIEAKEGLYINFGSHIVLQKKDGEYKLLTPAEDQTFYINIQKTGKALYANKVKGMIKIENEKVTEIFTEQLSQTINYYFIIDNQERFWVSTEKFGILVSAPGNDSFLEHTVSLPYNQSTYLYEDTDHNIWATNYEGLIKISEVDFVRYDATTDEAFEDIRCLATDQEGNLYFAPAGKGIYKLDPKTYKAERLSLDVISGYKSDVIDGISFDNHGALWAITRFGKLLFYKDKHAKDLTHLLPFAFNELYSIRFDPELQKMLIAADKLYVADEHNVISWGKATGLNEIANPEFICIRKDGSKLISTLHDGIFFIKNKNVKNISDQFDLPEPVMELRIYEDPAGGIWLTTLGHGIVRYEEKADGIFEKKVSITIKDGLPNNTIVSAVYDQNQKLWLTTLSGLATISKTKNPGEFKIDRIGEELGSRVLNWGPSGYNIACDKFNNIWVSTFHELFKFKTPGREYINKPPGISIENIKVNLKETDWNNGLSRGYFNLPETPALDYSENTLGITYRGISFSENPGIQYSYQLTNRASPDTTRSAWSDPTISDEVSFIRLPPGKYVFAVKAKQAGSAWSDPATFKFNIQPPFWLTWWFRSAVIIALLVIVLLIFKYRIRRIHKKTIIQQQLTDLEMKALKAQMNPHFIYNALNSIQSLVMDGKQEESVKYMSKFARLLRQVLEHSGAKFITLEKELQMLDLYVQLEMLRINAKLDYTVVIDDQILTEKECVPPLLLQPFVENAVWHGLSRKEHDKKLRIEINADDEWLYFTITDNGIGRQKAEEYKSGRTDYPRSMGIEITDKRLKVVNANQNPAISIHDISDAEGNPTGTQVRVKQKRVPGYHTS